MAGADRMTIEEVVRKVLLDEHADVIREAVKAVARGVDGARGVRADRRRAWRAPAEDRATHRNGYRARRWDTRAGEIELQIPKIRQGSYFPSFLEPRRRSEQALLAVVQQAYVCGVSTRRVDQLVESLGLRISKSEVSRICAGLDEQVEAFRTRPLEGRYPYLFLDAKVEKVRDGGRVVQQGAGDRPRRARDRPPRDHRPRRRRGRDRGVLDRVPARPGRARPGRRAAGDLRRPRRPEGRDREGAGLRLAALHRALPQRLPRPRPPRPARAAGGADPPDLQRRLARAGARPALRSRRAPRRPAARKVAAMLEDAEDDILAFYAFPADHWRKLRIDQPARALQPRDRPAHRRRRHLPRRPLADPPGRDALHRAERRVAGRPPLPLGRVDLSVLEDQTITSDKETRRRCPSSKRPEPPTTSPTT